MLYAGTGLHSVLGSQKVSKCSKPFCCLVLGGEVDVTHIDSLVGDGGFRWIDFEGRRKG